MQRKWIIGAALAASLSGTASAELTPLFETQLECSAAARVSSMLLRDTNAPQELQEQYTTFLLATMDVLSTAAPAAQMTLEQVDVEVARRTNLLVDKLNAMPDEAFRKALFKHISLEPDGGMAICNTVLKEVKIGE